MAQSQLEGSWPGELGRSALWAPTGVAGDKPLDLWSRVPARRAPHLALTVSDQAGPTKISTVLSAWRAEERRLADHIEASPVRSFIQSEISRLRADYHRLFALALTGTSHTAWAAPSRPRR